MKHACFVKMSVEITIDLRNNSGPSLNTQDTNNDYGFDSYNTVQIIALLITVIAVVLAGFLNFMLLCLLRRQAFTATTSSSTSKTTADTTRQ